MTVDAEQIVALEKGALDRWAKGDPSGFLELCAPEVTYFDPFIDRRIDGIDALTAYYEAARGKVAVNRYLLLYPNVCEVGDMAVLTFNYVSYGSNGHENRWNVTEVFRKSGTDWKIVQTHWSLTKPTLA